MITTRNEFETIPAFTVIAGSSLGGYSTREMCLEVLGALDNVVGFNTTFEHWQELARYSDIDDADALDDLLDDLIEFFNDNIDTMPDFCSLVMQDNELIVLPDVDGMADDTIRLDHIPDSLYDDSVGRTHYAIAHVNDHGNVDYCTWDDSRREYVIQWSVV